MMRAEMQVGPWECWSSGWGHGRPPKPNRSRLLGSLGKCKYNLMPNACGRYYVYVKHKMIENLDRGTTCRDFPVTPPRLISLLRAAVPERGLICLDNGLYKVGPGGTVYIIGGLCSGPAFGPCHLLRVLSATCSACTVLNDVTFPINVSGLTLKLTVQTPLPSWVLQLIKVPNNVYWAGRQALGSSHCGNAWGKAILVKGIPTASSCVISHQEHT